MQKNNKPFPANMAKPRMWRQIGKPLFPPTTSGQMVFSFGRHAMHLIMPHPSCVLGLVN